MTQPSHFTVGQPVTVKIQGEYVEAVYVGWHPDYKMAIVEYEGQRFYRKVYPNGGVSKTAAPVADVKPSRFSVNQRFEFIETLTDMVIAGDSKSVIISGSGGLGKTYTVTARLQAAGLIDTSETAEISDESLDDDEINKGYVVVKGYMTPKAMYRFFWLNRKRIIVFDDCDSVWLNDTSVSLLKGALDSYETRRIGWHAEIKNDDDDLPQSFEFLGRIIFISNLSLTQLDQAVLSRCLYVDVSMTPAEKIERIRAISADIRKDLDPQLKTEAIDLLAQFAESIGDLNIRTFLKVLEIRARGTANWKELAEYVITAL